jgi:flagellar basal-body rod protein FlgF
MGDIVDFAIQVLASSERRLEASAQNIANISTPGYKRVLSFDASVFEGNENYSQELIASYVSDHSSGRLMVTGNSQDMAILGEGFFALNSGEGVVYTKLGRFHRDADGRLVNERGAALMSADGLDIKVASDTFEIAADGMVMDAGEPAGRIALMTTDTLDVLSRVSDSAFTAPESAMRPAEGASIRQGMLEASNVVVADEMVGMMEALRRAESGQRLVMVYDELMGRVIGAMGQS